MTAHTSPERTWTPHEAAMVEYARRWAGYDGGDEYILAEFGLTPAQFYRRVLSLVAPQPTLSHNDVQTQLRKVCIDKLTGLRRRIGPPAHRRN